jgi:hypothetical protein
MITECAIDDLQWRAVCHPDRISCLHVMKYVDVPAQWMNELQQMR